MTPDDFCTVKQVAAALSVNEKTVYEAIKSGELPGAFHIGRRIRLHKPTVLAWFSSRHEPKKRRPSR